LRGEIVRAKPAVQAFRTCKGSGWQNGKWLLMGSHQPVRSEWENPEYGRRLTLPIPPDSDHSALFRPIVFGA
jgi:hypothetical protein